MTSTDTRRLAARALLRRAASEPAPEPVTLSRSLAVYTLREPLIDLAGGGDHWKTQPRGTDGRFISTGGAARKAAKAAFRAASGKFDNDPPPKASTRRAISLTPSTHALAPPPVAGQRVPDSEVLPNHPTFEAWEAAQKTALVEGKKIRGDQWGIENPEFHRRLSRATKEDRKKLYEANGLRSKYPDVTDEDLLDRWQGADGATKAELMAEIERRRTVLDITDKAVQRALKDAKRGDKSQFWAKFDNRLREVKGGKHILAIRDKVLNDKVLDRGEAFKEVVKKNAPGYAASVATAIALGTVFGPLGAFLTPVVKNHVGGVLQAPPVAELLELSVGFLGYKAVNRETRKVAAKIATRRAAALPTR